MIHETLEAIELGQAEALIETKGQEPEEIWDKFTPITVPYIEFERPICQPTT